MGHGYLDADAAIDCVDLMWAESGEAVWVSWGFWSDWSFLLGRSVSCSDGLVRSCCDR